MPHFATSGVRSNSSSASFLSFFQAFSHPESGGMPLLSRNFPCLSGLSTTGLPFASEQALENTCRPRSQDRLGFRPPAGMDDRGNLPIETQDTRQVWRDSMGTLHFIAARLKMLD